jgi:hypothetical protein
MKQRITPVGLKGYEINERMKELMGMTPINENKKSSVIELTKKGPDGKIYGIVRENHEYYIKVSTKLAGKLMAEDFSYIGGLQNKKQEVYPTYSKAIKHLNLKFNSLNEAYGKSGQVNVFETDGYGINEEVLCGECGGTTYEGVCQECGYQMNEFDAKAMDGFKDQYGAEDGESIYYATANKQGRNPETFEKNEGMMDELSGKQQRMAALAGNPNAIDAADLAALRGGASIDEDLPMEMQAIDDMYVDEMTDDEQDFAALAEPKDKITYADKIAGATRSMRENKLSIERAINEMDVIIDSITKPRKKKVYTLK